MNKRTITISQSTYDTILNELHAARDSFRHACKEQDIDLVTSNELEAEEFRAIDEALKELV